MCQSRGTGKSREMTEITNPHPDQPAGASTMEEESTLPGGSSQMLDSGSTGTDDGPAGIPANLAGVDKSGDEVAPPPAADGGDVQKGDGPGHEDDLLSPADSANPLQTSSSRGETAASRSLRPPEGGADPCRGVPGGGASSQRADQELRGSAA